MKQNFHHLPAGSLDIFVTRKIMREESAILRRKQGIVLASRWANRTLNGEKARLVGVVWGNVT